MAARANTVGGWRRILAVGLVVAATIVAFLAVLSIWVNRQVLNTDNWTQTSSELLQQPVIRNQLAARLTDELFASVDVEQTFREALPPRAQVLAGPAANALRTQVEKTARKALARPRVQALWADANRTAHEQLLLVLEGNGDVVSTRGDSVVLDMKSLLGHMQQQVGVGGRLRKVLPASATQITLLQAGQIGTAQKVLRLLKPLPVALVLLSLGLFGAAVAVAPGWRRRALRAYGIGFVLAGAGALLARSIGGDQFVSSFARTAAAEPAVAEVWSIATALLVSVAVATIAYGVVMVAGAWLAGPTSAAVAVRRTVSPYWREPVIAYAALALIVAVLVWWAPTPAWRNGPMLLILVALLVAGVEVLRRQMIREFPDTSRAETARRRSERWARFTAASRARGATLRDSASRTVQSATSGGSASSNATVTRFESPQDTRLEQLERLAQLRAAGVLDDDELRAEKARILDNGSIATHE
jgi:hypothetical protein